MQKKKAMNMMNIKNAAIAGMMVGTAVGMMAKSMMRPKKKKIAKSAGKAIGAVGDVMHSVSSYMR